MGYRGRTEAIDDGSHEPGPHGFVVRPPLEVANQLRIDFLQDFALPPHSHKGQWGTVVSGTVEITINGVARVYRPGESYDIPTGVVHAVRVTAGTKAIDVFEEPDRYPLKR